MKRISTKIIILSLINSLIIAVMNGIMSQDLSRSNQGSAAMTHPDQLLFLPMPVLISILSSLAYAAITAYMLGRYMSKPIIKVTENKIASLNSGIVKK